MALRILRDSSRGVNVATRREKRKRAIPTITVYVEGGVVQSVDIPTDMPTCRVAVHDYDTDGAIKCPVDNEGRQYTLEIHEGGKA